MIPTYVFGWPTGKEQGNFLAVDLGTCSFSLHVQSIPLRLASDPTSTPAIGGTCIRAVKATLESGASSARASRGGVREPLMIRLVVPYLRLSHHSLTLFSQAAPTFASVSSRSRARASSRSHKQSTVSRRSRSRTTGRSSSTSAASV